MRVFSIPIAIGIAGIIVAITIAPSAVAAADKHQQSGAGGDGAGVAKAQGPPPFFLQDSSNSLCFAGEDFRRCSVDTLFFVVGLPGSYRIHKRPQDDVDVNPDGTCVSKKSCDKIDPATVARGDASGDASAAAAAAAAATTDVKLAKCTHCGAKAWNIHGDSTTGYVLTESSSGAQLCLVRPRGTKHAHLAPCESSAEANFAVWCTHMHARQDCLVNPRRRRFTRSVVQFVVRLRCYACKPIPQRMEDLRERKHASQSLPGKSVLGMQSQRAQVHLPLAGRCILPRANRCILPQA